MSKNYPDLTAVEYALFCEKVKSMEPVNGYTVEGFKYSTGYINNGFWGCIYAKDDQAVVCFKGTGNAKIDQFEVGSDNPNHSLVGDLLADLKLSLGVIPNQASTAKKLFERAKKKYGSKNLSICGHSLGGYLAQVVSYWYAVPCVTFNAPGAWGDLQKAKINMFKPQVAWRSVKSTFKWEAICVNFMHVGDVVGNFGFHRGRTFRIADFNPAHHGIKHMRQNLENHDRWATTSPFETRKGAKGVWDRI